MTPSLFINQEATVQEEPGLSVVLLVAAMAGAGAGLCFDAAQWFQPGAARALALHSGTGAASREMAH